MNVLLVTDSFPPRCGGSGFSVEALAVALKEAGTEATVLHRVAGSGKRCSPVEHLDVETWRLEIPDLRVPVLREAHRALVRDRALEAAIAERLAARGTDVIHAQQGTNFGPVLRAARRAGVAAVATVRDYAPVCLRTTRFSGGAICPGCTAKRLARCYRDRYGSAGRLLAPAVPLGLWATRSRTRTLSRFDQVIAVSRYVRERLCESGVDAPIEVISNLPPPVVASPSRPAAAGSDPYVLFAGKLNREKGADWLAAVAASLKAPNRLVVLGEGPEAPLLDSARAKGAPIDRLGSVPNGELLSWLAHARLLVLPSRWAEPLSRLLLEAGAVGTPVVALATGGTPEWIEDGINGLLVQDEASLAEGVARVCDDPTLRERLAEGMRRAAAARIARAELVERVGAVYSCAVASRH